MQVVTEILIDFSGSMKKKLSITKTILKNDIIPHLDYSTKIGVKTFAASTSWVPAIKTILPLSVTNNEQLDDAINTLGNPNGNTPIAAAIKHSVNSLKEYAAFDKKIILITDGEENCGGDYTIEVNNAKVDGINCEIHIIGIGLNSKGTNQAVDISTLSNGSFSSINFNYGTVYNQDRVKINLTPFYSSINNTPKPSQPSNNISEITPTEETLTKAAVQNVKNEIEPKDIISEASNEQKESNNSIIENSIEEKETFLELVEDKKVNEEIRSISESFLFEFLSKKYPNRVKWLNEQGESGEDHDFEIVDLDGSIEYYIECKGTAKNKSTFYLTKYEWRLFLNHTKNYQIYFIRNSFDIPTYVFIDNLLDWLLKGKVVPYLKEPEAVEKNRVFLTLVE